MTPTSSLNLQAERPAVADGWRLPVGSLGWLILLQWIALAVCLLDVPLAETLRDAQGLGVRAVLAAQMGAVSLLGCRWRLPTALLAAVVNLPLPLLAAGIASQPLPFAMAAGTISGLFGLALSGWGQVFASERSRRFLQAFGLLATVGAGLLGYLAVEFKGDPAADAAAPSMLIASPLWLAWRLSDGADGTGGSIITLLLSAVAGWTWFGVMRLRPKIIAGGR